MLWSERRLRRRATRLLERGDVEKAIVLFKKAGAWDALVGAYGKQGDLTAAAAAAKKAGAFDQAAELFERAGDYRDAADLWLRVGQKERAAVAFEKADDFKAAVELHLEADKPIRAADALAILGQYSEAGKLYEQTGEIQKAVKMYREANRLVDAARVLQEAGDLSSAAHLYEESGDGATAAELFVKAGELLESVRCHKALGEFERAGALLEEAGHLFEAAEAYEECDATLENAGDLLSSLLRPELSWRVEMTASPVCLNVNASGGGVAIGCGTHRVQWVNEDGELVWSFRPPSGGVPQSIASSKDGAVAIGCDDRRLHFLDDGRTLRWSYKLPDAAAKVAIDRSGERVVCCTNGADVVCIGRDGTLCWDYHAKSHVWDVAFAADGTLVAVGLLDGSCVFLTRDGEVRGRYFTEDWVHSVSLNEDGTLCALGAGMRRVEFVDVSRLKRLRSIDEGSPVHRVRQTPAGAVLIITDEHAILRDKNGGVIWRYAAESRLMSGAIDPEEQFIILRCVKKTLEKVELRHCRERAAIAYEKAECHDKAGVVYEEMGDHGKALEHFVLADNPLGAARNNKIMGRLLDAAELYERAGAFDEAAALFESEGKIERAAECYERAGTFDKAGRLHKQAGNLEAALKAFEKASQFDKAGELYQTMGKVSNAVSVLSQYVASHPDDIGKQLKLGKLLEENGQYDEAIEQFQRTALSEEYHRESLKHMADCFAAKNLYDIAINRYESSLGGESEVSSQNLDVHYGMAKTYEMAGNYTEAKRIYQSILAVSLQYRDVSERLERVKSLANVFTPSPGSNVGETQWAPGNTYQALPAETKDRYAVKKLLGRGGMGEVYLAEDERLKRTVALKILPPQLAADENLTLRMVREAQAVAQISHPNVVAVFDVGNEAGRAYISMEYVEGENLRSLLKEKGTYSAEECVALLQQITAGLGCAHEEGILHRDMKPENVMLATDGTVKLMDFGLAVVQGLTRMTVPGGISGTWFYMAPEQVRGEATLTAAVDIYALGCVAYELLTGKPPFDGDNVGMQHLNVAPMPLAEARKDLPAELCDIIMKCIEKRPEDRYADANELGVVLERYIQNS